MATTNAAAKTTHPYRVILPTSGSSCSFQTFDEALEFAIGFPGATIANDDRTDGGKQQGLTEDEYLRALEALS